jgi:hypothetical protein
MPNGFLRVAAAPRSGIGRRLLSTGRAAATRRPTTLAVPVEWVAQVEMAVQAAQQPAAPWQPAGW